MLPLSVTIIAQNEEDRLPAAIGSVSFADEVVVVDGGSVDGTVAVARELGAVVVEARWPGHVAQKNRALEHASHQWVLSIDADEQVSPDLAEQIREVLAGQPSHSGFAVRRLSWWCGAPLRHGTWYPDRRIRLFRRDLARWSGHDPHDHVEVEGEVGELSGELYHHPYRTLAEHFETIDRYTALEAATAQQRGVRAGWLDLLFRPPLHFVKALLLKRGFLDGLRGVCVACLGAGYVALKWFRIRRSGSR